MLADLSWNINYMADTLSIFLFFVCFKDFFAFHVKRSLVLNYGFMAFFFKVGKGRIHLGHIMCVNFFTLPIYISISESVCHCS